MKVKELIERLQKLDPEMLVMLEDEEHEELGPMCIPLNKLEITKISMIKNDKKVQVVTVCVLSAW